MYVTRHDRQLPHTMLRPIPLAHSLMTRMRICACKQHKRQDFARIQDHMVHIFLHRTHHIINSRAPQMPLLTCGLSELLRI
jgi:hypothetical protein